MDRLICGDVGFGKTEVAIRAAFKPVDGREQSPSHPDHCARAAQHFENVPPAACSIIRCGSNVEAGFRSHAREQRKVLEKPAQAASMSLSERIAFISGDVVFKDLGLVVIDEEQRFGVLHKEKFKDTFKSSTCHALARRFRAALLVVSRVPKHVDNRDPAAQSASGETVICGYDERISAMRLS